MMYEQMARWLKRRYPDARLLSCSTDEDGDGCLGVATFPGHSGALLIVGDFDCHFHAGMFYRTDLPRMLRGAGAVLKQWREVGGDEVRQ
jgi:hypothetical protein